MLFKGRKPPGHKIWVDVGWRPKLWRKKREVQPAGVSCIFLTYWKSSRILALFCSSQVEKFFEPSVNAIAEGIEIVTAEVDPQKTVSIRFVPEAATTLSPSSLFSSSEI